MSAMPIEPDRKDWTWVIDAPCPECGFTGAEPHELPAALRADAAAWPDVLAREDAAVRPAENVWSALEYACHVRDVHRLFAERVALMLEQDDPTFANWDQDATAVAESYGEQDPTRVAGELVAAAEEAARAYEGVGDRWDRPGTRSNGSTFTIATLGRYHLHDVVHHLHDVGGS
jgi:hypothetical protein